MWCRVIWHMTLPPCSGLESKSVKQQEDSPTCLFLVACLTFWSWIWISIFLRNTSKIIPDTETNPRTIDFIVFIGYCCFRIVKILWHFRRFFVLFCHAFWWRESLLYVWIQTSILNSTLFKHPVAVIYYLFPTIYFRPQLLLAPFSSLYVSAVHGHHQVSTISLNLLHCMVCEKIHISCKCDTS
jgi:hypothetical protein